MLRERDDNENGIRDASEIFLDNVIVNSDQLIGSLDQGHGILEEIMDRAIAACALVHEAAVWTRNDQDFNDIPGLDLFKPK